MRQILSNVILGIAVIGIFGNVVIQANPPQSGDRLAESAEEICPLLVGQSVPDVPLTTAEGEAINLSEALAQKPTLLIFYRGGWCPFCNTHLAELQSIQDDLRALGYQILAISMDRPAKLQQSLDEHDLTYTLLSDSTAVAVKAFGLAFKATKSNTDRLESYSGRDHHILPVPAAFIVGKDGMIRFEYINPNYQVRVKSEIVLAAAKAEIR